MKVKMKKVNKNKVKNKKGFTLIELLAVIVIMGVLMFAAIASYNVIIENSRKSTFANTAGAYLDAISRYELAQEIVCYPATNGVADTTNAPTVTSADDTYVFYIATDNSIGGISNTGLTGTVLTNNFKTLMSTGGKSSWNDANVLGYVKWTKSGGTTTYSVKLSDVNGHGMTSETTQSNINKNAIATSGADTTITPVTDASYVCTLSS